MRNGNAPKTLSGIFIDIIKTDGVHGLYTGLSASLLRQVTYSTVRFSIYEDLKMRLDRSAGDPSFLHLITIAALSGFAGGVVGNIGDILNVRMQRDATLPVMKRRNYKHAFVGMVRMAREEGMRSWFRGVLPTSTRAAFMTASQLASYDETKRLVHKYMGSSWHTS